LTLATALVAGSQGVARAEGNPPPAAPGPSGGVVAPAAGAPPPALPGPSAVGVAPAYAYPPYYYPPPPVPTATGGGAVRRHDELPPAIERVSAGPPRPPGPWQVSLGFRSALFRSTGYDPFSTNDVFVQAAVAASWALRTSPTLATAVGATFDSGSADAQARGSASSLSLTRLGALVEERFAPRPWLYGFARLSPSSLRGTATVHDVQIPAPLQTTFSSLAVDGSVGAAARLTYASSRVGFWVVGDAGYGWAPDQHLALAPALPGTDSNKAGVTTLADLAPRGVFFRAAIAVNF
jgi:hypothetical protein